MSLDELYSEQEIEYQNYLDDIAEIEHKELEESEIEARAEDKLRDKLRGIL